MEQILIEKNILDLEQQLLMKDVRQSTEKISELLSCDFIEFCSSGQVYRYSKGDVFDDEASFDSVQWEIIEFSIKLLVSDVVLATYKLIKHNEKAERKYSLRSSIWKLIDNKWKMVFHQGTIASELG